MKNGWYYIKTNKKWHYFEGAYSLCVVYHSSERDPNDAGGGDAEIHCKVCQKVMDRIEKGAR